MTRCGRGVPRYGCRGQIQEMVMVGVRREDGLLVVAALGDVQPIARRGETRFTGHEKRSSIE